MLQDLHRLLEKPGSMKCKAQTGYAANSLSEEQCFPTQPISPSITFSQRTTQFSISKEGLLLKESAISTRSKLIACPSMTSDLLTTVRESMDSQTHLQLLSGQSKSSWSGLSQEDIAFIFITPSKLLPFNHPPDRLLILVLLISTTDFLWQLVPIITTPISLDQRSLQTLQVASKHTISTTDHTMEFFFSTRTQAHPLAEQYK